jgi:hypothetical protein
VWYYPNAVYVDAELLPKTVAEKETRYKNWNHKLETALKDCIQTEIATP